MKLLFCIVNLAVVFSSASSYDEVITDVLATLRSSPELVESMNLAKDGTTKLRLVQTRIPERTSQRLSELLRAQPTTVGAQCDSIWYGVRSIIFNLILSRNKPACELMTYLIEINMMGADFVRDALQGRMTLDELYLVASDSAPAITFSRTGLTAVLVSTTLSQSIEALARLIVDNFKSRLVPSKDETHLKSMSEVEAELNKDINEIAHLLTVEQKSEVRDLVSEMATEIFKVSMTAEEVLAKAQRLLPDDMQHLPLNAAVQTLLQKVSKLEERLTAIGKLCGE